MMNMINMMTSLIPMETIDCLDLSFTSSIRVSSCSSFVKLGVQVALY